jgi:hypothetical protein
MDAKNNPNQGEVEFFLHHWKKIRIKLLPQLWVEVFTFFLRKYSFIFSFVVLCWCLLQLVLQAKKPDGSCPVHRPGQAHMSG